LPVRDKLHLHRLGQRLAGQIVGGRPQPAGYQDQLGGLHRATDRLDDGRLLVADGPVCRGGDPSFSQGPRQIGAVRIDGHPAYQLVPHRDNQRIHAYPT